MATDVERTTSTCPTMSACEVDCTAAKPGACARVEQLIAPLAGDAAAARRAVELVEVSCRTRGDAKACSELASFLDAGVVLRRDAARANELWGEASKAFRAACQHGDHVACRDAEDIFRKGRGVAVDPTMFTGLHEKAVAIYRTACPTGDLDACEELVDEVEDDAKKSSLRQALCDGGRPAACVALARALPDGKARAALEQKAQAIRQRRCFEEGRAGECLALGIELEAPSLSPKYRRPEAALAPLKKGCELGDHQSCLRASSILGHAGKVDDALATQRKYLSMVEGLCALPVPVACADLASEYDRGDLLTADKDKARAYRAKACQGGIKHACAP